jgi:hypothetical protein
MPHPPYRLFSKSIGSLATVLPHRVRLVAGLYLAAALLLASGVAHGLCLNADECPLESCAAEASCENNADCQSGMVSVPFASDPVVGCAPSWWYGESSN